MPDIPPSEYVTHHWQELGYARGLSMGGYGPFEWQEIEAYKRSTEAEISPIEAQCLMDMSRAYARALADTNPLSIEPMERAND